ncbi:EamA family transporter RarD [Sphingomonas aerophila]|uniref:Chloramphenicol-sensitive protein RarD n=1 Tax=Sphingomonas aerophila TaxID=1344948 RepID=A0A7W9EUA8_9SPHN|nr:EamA family transporter RarD [Sphingomonas aerophila]MBB5715099.1 chloramphenicol-sensitive protein RarD [Sphingomonas aerophila]
MANTAPLRTGLVLGVAAYVSWGLLPLYLKLLHTVPSLQVLSHRVVWSLLLLAVIVVALRRVRAIWAAARGRTLGLLCASAALIAVNWLVYIWAVQHAHVLEASLGYFINPLVNVALGVVVLGERVSRVQWVAVAIAAAGVVVLAINGGGQLWISIALALSFGFYGLVRKVAAIDALGGLTVETLLLGPVALGVIWWAGAHGQGAWGHDARLDALLVLAGAVTAAPLLMFAAAARRLRYATMGLLQYLAPTLQFLQAVLLFGEPLRPVHFVTFALIWTGCALYAFDSVRAARRGEPAKA